MISANVQTLPHVHSWPKEAGNGTVAVCIQHTGQYAEYISIYEAGQEMGGN